MRKVFWQFKNGTIAPCDIIFICNMILENVITLRPAFDRSLGGWVYYER